MEKLFKKLNFKNKPVKYILIEEEGINCDPNKGYMHPCERCELFDRCTNIHRENGLCIEFDREFIIEHPDAFFIKVIGG